MIAIVVSRADSASEHIGERLLDVGDWTAHEDSIRLDSAGGGAYYRSDGFELREFDDLHIELDDPAEAFSESPAYLAFVSRHSGETGKLLTAHVTGNFGPAPYGGAPATLSRAAPGAEKRVIDALATHAPDGYEVGIECTHHGPTNVSVPSLFVELGSGEQQWADSEAASAVARAVLDLRGTSARYAPDAADCDSAVSNDTTTGGRPRHVVGFGGGHYAPRFTRIVRETEWAVGHVGADWALGEMGTPEANREVIEQAFTRSDADLAVIEGDRPDLVTTIEDLGHRVVSETWVREVGSRPLALVDQLESVICNVDDGLRFGDVSIKSAKRGGDATRETGGDATRETGGDATRETGSDATQVRELPAALLTRAQGINPEATREAVGANAVAFETEQAGTRAAGRAAFAVGDGSPTLADLVTDLADVIKQRYDEVTIQRSEGRPGAVVASETAFDPGLAAERGVPEGPAFGRLADGQSVEVDGETVTPGDVSRSQTERFPIAREPNGVRTDR